MSMKLDKIKSRVMSRSGGRFSGQMSNLGQGAILAKIPDLGLGLKAKVTGLRAKATAMRPKVFKGAGLMTGAGISPEAPVITSFDEVKASSVDREEISIIL